MLYYYFNSELIRGCTALFISFALSIMFGNKIISFLKTYQSEGQPIRDDGPETHAQKAGTPTMGGIIIILSSFVALVFCIDFSNYFILISLFVFIALGFLGFLDDYSKLKRKNHRGVSARFKFIYQMIVSILVYLVVLKLIPESATKIYLPIFKNIQPDIGLFFLPFVVFIITGTSNAVNLTDGLDGLAILPFAISTCFYAIIAYIVGSQELANVFKLPFIPQAKELIVICCCLIGSSMGFLWFYTKPAQIFMGDTGSLGIGGFLGVISILTKQEIILSITGIIFVLEALSVIIQVLYFKVTKGKRILKMAPLHHHYEKNGLSESKIVVRFWIISIVSTIFSLYLICLN